MALIKCPECGKEVSDRAPSCPNCGYPFVEINNNSQTDNSAELERYLDLAAKAVASQNVEQVQDAVRAALKIDPNCSRAWELEARGTLFNSSLAKNNVMSAIGAAVNAINCADESEKTELADSLYGSIVGHINGLANISMTMPTLLQKMNYYKQCLSYYQELLTSLPNMSKEKREAELASWDRMEADSKKAFMPNKRILYAVMTEKHTTFANECRDILKAKGML